jgi:S1-C subfamily serine protease
MLRLPTFLAVACGLLVGLATVSLAALDDNKEKEKPKNAPTLDDRTAMLTETVDGKEKKTKLDLKYCLKVTGYFDKDGFNIEEVEPGGPAAQLSGGAAMMEKGDIIVEVEGKKIKSAQDYVKAINGAEDHTKIKIKVRDVRTGNDQDFEVGAAEVK